MRLENIMLSEISLMEKRQMLHGITYVWNLKKKVGIIETQSRNSCLQLGMGGNGNTLENGYKFSVIT